MVNFLELTPRSYTEQLEIETADGPVTLELGGIKLGTLGDIAKRFPTFARVIEGGVGSVMEASEAMPAVIAAGLGHTGDAEYENKISEFAAPDILTMAMTVLRLTFPAPRQSAGDPERPLPAAVDGAAGPIAISPSASSN
jgi:hypothetical protein